MSAKNGITSAPPLQPLLIRNEGSNNLSEGNVECRGNIPGLKNSLEGLCFHDLRHSTAIKLMEQGTPFALVTQILGWSASTAVRLIKRYGHIRPEARRQALTGAATEEIQTGVHQFVHQPGRALQSTLRN